MSKNISNEINNYKFTFDLPVVAEIQEYVDKMIKQEIKLPTPPPPYSFPHEDLLD